MRCNTGPVSPGEMLGTGVGRSLETAICLRKAFPTNFSFHHFFYDLDYVAEYLPVMNAVIPSEPD